MKPILFGALAVALGLGLSCAQVRAGATFDRVKASGTVKVCIWPDYYGITFRNPRNQQLGGIDIDLSSEFAKSLGVRLVYVESSFATLVDDLLKERCDVSMHAVGITSQRQQVLTFSQPYLRSDIYAVTTLSNRTIRQWDDIDRTGVVVAVQAGTYMEPVMRASLKHATIRVVKPPDTREQELEAGRVDVFMTDFPYSRRLLDNADWARLVSPVKAFSPMPYGYAIKPGDDVWLRALDQFVSTVKQDGRLSQAAKRFGLTEIVER